MKTCNLVSKTTLGAIVGVAFALAMLATASAYAFVQTSSAVRNNFSVAECAIEIVEDFQLPEIIAPGSKITKDVRFRNTGTGACFVRAYVELSSDDVEGWASIDYNDADWQRADDGYWYCRQALDVEQSTPPVCTAVTISEDADASLLHSFDVLAWGEAVTAKSPTGDTYQNGQSAFLAQAQRGIQ